MQTETLEEERPFLRPFRSTLPWPIVLLAVAVAGVAAYYYYELYCLLAEPPAANVVVPALIGGTTPIELRATRYAVSVPATNVEHSDSAAHAPLSAAAEPRP
ncbi:MAG: hypothetical protein ABR570_12505 [Burkholderiales bacterium]